MPVVVIVVITLAGAHVQVDAACSCGALGDNAGLRVDGGALWGRGWAVGDGVTVGQTLPF